MADFRSDTVTQPTEAMRQAMINAPLGDDVFGDDPTVILLEKKAATLFGKEAALFCASGTMTNQIAMKVHTKPGDEIICSDNAHVFKYEGGGMASNSGAQARCIMGDRGRINATQVEECINIDDIHFARTALVCLENTNNRGGGSIYNAASIVDISKVCKQQHLPLHLDGARIFNALAETGQSPQDAAAPFDSLSVCLSKGLGCPVGSLLLGSYDFIIQAKRVRKVFGGGWRQAGFLAAAGIYALDHHIIRLKEDHAKAKYLGDFLLQQHFVESLLPVETNIVIMNLKPEYSADYILFKLNEAGIKASKINLYSIRFVLHLDITDEMLAHTIEVMKRF